MKLKQEGSVLMPTMIISAMILALALTLTRLVSSELQFSSDLLLGERAYFAAESGVEGALLGLKDEPINLIELTSPLPSNSETQIMVYNAVKEFDFEITPKNTLRWRLGLDSSKKFSFKQTAVRDLKITGENLDGDLQWKVQCGEGGVTKVIQSRATGNTIDLNSNGTTDEGDYIGLETLGEYLKKVGEKSVCYMSLTNFGNNDISGTLSAPNKIAPPQTKVQAKGYAGGREKIIEFQYRQKNLAPFFDFGLLHSN